MDVGVARPCSIAKNVLTHVSYKLCCKIKYELISFVRPHQSNISRHDSMDSATSWQYLLDSCLFPK